MNESSRKIRLAILAVLFILVLLVFSLRLMQFQVVEGNSLSAQMERVSTAEQTIKAARGEILDRNGRPLAVNTIGRDVVINMAYLDMKDINGVLLRLIHVMEDAREEWTDNLPLTAEAPFQFKSGENYAPAISRLKKNLGLAQYATAEDVMFRLRERYDPPKKQKDGEPTVTPLSETDLRKVAGVRYEMEQRGFSMRTPYTFATGIKIETVPKIKERGYELPGVDVMESTLRQYVSGTVGPHLIGQIGPLYKNEWDEAKKIANNDGTYLAKIGDRDYRMDDVIGKSGAEQAFETYLKGVDGARKIMLNSAGDVMDVVEEQAQVPGNSVVLTLDSKLQQVAQDSLASNIKRLNDTKEEKKGKEAEAGAVAVVNCKTGEALALASYPSFDLSTYQKDYDQLAQADNQPLFNRALNAAYTPGSSFKPAVAVAALAEGIVTPASHVDCTYIYTRFAPGYQPRCESMHGPINVVNALRWSCNIYFYETAYNMGIEKLDEYAAKFGMGQKTGIELGENKGQVASPALKETLPAYADDPVWRPGDVLQAGIGQQATMLSPLQLANYTATLANNGKRMKTTLLKSVKSYTFDETIYEHQPEIAEQIDAPEAFDTVREGMVAASRIGTAAGTFANYPITVASKTGTPERGDGYYNSVFIAYAPAEDPEIAVAVVVEKGWEGYQVAPVARDIFDAYFFSRGGKTIGAPDYGTLLP